LPVVVGAERGIVTALSYEAKALGVTRGLPIFQLKRRFPQVIVLPGDYASYVAYNARMVEIVRRYVDEVEEYSIDECFGDLTGLEKPLKMTKYEIAARIKKEIRDELDISVSVGVAPTKVLAKVASKWVKPDGLTIINEDDAPRFLQDIPVGKVWGIGSQTSQYLERHGIQTAGELRAKSREWIYEHLDKPGRIIWHELNGTAILEVDPHPKTLYNSIQKTRTFHPSTGDKVFLFSQISKHMEDACAKARHYGLLPTSASIFLKTKDFHYATRPLPLPFPTNAPEILLSIARKEFDLLHGKGILYRTAGVGLYGLTPQKALAQDLFGIVERAAKFEEVHRSIDKLEEKYGRRVVHLASTERALREERQGTEADEVERDLLFL
jgi:DNA polymerase-4/DNA polymerase V